MGKGKLHPNILTNLIGQSVIMSYFPDFDGSVQWKMPLYRTVSDRGLWKKYKRDSVQHFHKPQYLEKAKNEPQVSKSAFVLASNLTLHYHSKIIASSLHAVL